MRELYKIRRLPHRFRPDMAVRSIPTKGQAELHRMPSHAPRQWELRSGWWILHRCSGSVLPIDSRVARRKRAAALRSTPPPDRARYSVGGKSAPAGKAGCGSGGGMSMERLTKKVDGVWTALCNYGSSPYPVVTQEIIDRLAAYEDTGFTPEEVRQMRWIPVEERLPDKPGHYLVCTNVNYWHGGCMDKNGSSSNAGTTDGYAGTTLSVLDCFYDITGDWNRVCNAHVTHWMPLPSLPKEEKKND